MYSLYQREVQNGKTQLKFLREVALSGCKKGIIPKLLGETLTSKSNPPMRWELPIADLYHENNNSIVIDINPKSKEEVFLSELDRVFGFTYETWTPIMLRTKVIVNSMSFKEFDKNNFFYPAEADTVYTFLYLAGSLKEGNTVGKWTFTRPSSTNGPMLWPDALRYFFDCIKKYDPSIFE